MDYVREEALWGGAQGRLVGGVWRGCKGRRLKGCREGVDGV